jgi:hypothetical protein
MTTVGAPPRARLSVAVARVRRVPDLYRRYTEPVAAATREHLLDTGLLEQLVELGLPVSGRGDGMLFDPLDLANVALTLGRPTPRLVTMRGWRSALLRAAGGTAVDFHLRVRPRCPASVHGPECDLAVAPELAARGAMAGPPRRAEPHHWSLRIDPRGDAEELTGAARELVTLLAGVDFHLLPVELSEDLGFLREQRLSDCRLAARFLLDAAAARGLPVRESFGFIVASPFATAHSWVELRTGDRWVSADPLTLKALADCGLLDARDWPLWRSPGAALWRLGDGLVPLVTRDGRSVPVSLPTHPCRGGPS